MKSEFSGHTAARWLSLDVKWHYKQGRRRILIRALKEDMSTKLTPLVLAIQRQYTQYRTQSSVTYSTGLSGIVFSCIPQCSVHIYMRWWFFFRKLCYHYDYIKNFITIVILSHHKILLPSSYKTVTIIILLPHPLVTPVILLHYSYHPITINTIRNTHTTSSAFNKTYLNKHYLHGFIITATN